MFKVAAAIMLGVRTHQPSNQLWNQRKRLTLSAGNPDDQFGALAKKHGSVS